MGPDTFGDKKDYKNQWIIYVVFVSDKMITFRKKKNFNFTNRIGTDVEKTERLTALVVQEPKHMCVAY